jgi:hypothetical protein
MTDPPPVPRGALQGGKRRRGKSKALALVLLLLAPVVVGGAAIYVLLEGDSRHSVPVASGGPAGSSALVSQTPKTPVPPAPPAVRLDGSTRFACISAGNRAPRC